MITWYEGEILDYDEPDDKDDPVLRITVRELTQNIEITNVQMHLKDNFQERPLKKTPTSSGSTIAFYRDSAATAKYGFLLRDPVPISSPIAIETAILAAQSSDLLFEEGEVAFKARGEDALLTPTPGANLWLRNSGDGLLSSGSYSQRVAVSDSTDSVDIEGTNVDIYSHGNILTTHAIHIDCDSFGVTSLSLGIKNPTTGVFASRLHSDMFGGFTIGLADPVLDTLLSGLSYTVVPSLPGPVSVPECKLTSVLLASQLTVNPLGTSINGPTITLAGTAAIGEVAAPAVAVNVLAATVNLTSPLTTVEGTLTVVGTHVVAGDTVLVGTNPARPLITAEVLPGPLSVLLSYTGVLLPAAPGPQTAAGITGKIPIIVNGAPMNILVGA